MTLGSQSPRFRSQSWIFNSLMIWGAALGFIIILTAGKLIETMQHKGPGVVHYGDGERGPEWSEEVSEAKYKSHNYFTHGFLLALGFWFWYIVAKSARDE